MSNPGAPGQGISNREVKPRQRPPIGIQGRHIGLPLHLGGILAPLETKKSLTGQMKRLFTGMMPKVSNGVDMPGIL